MCQSAFETPVRGLPFQGALQHTWFVEVTKLTLEETCVTEFCANWRSHRGFQPDPACHHPVSWPSRNREFHRSAVAGIVPGPGEDRWASLHRSRPNIRAEAMAPAATNCPTSLHSCIKNPPALARRGIRCFKGNQSIRSRRVRDGIDIGVTARAWSST